ITDDTQMTLFTAEGLVLSSARQEEFSAMTPPEFVYQAYLRWLTTQGEVDPGQMVRQYGSCGMIDGVLTTYPALHARRAPGNSCLSALKSGRMGTIQAPINNSKGCGGVMRIAPVGLYLDGERVFDAACDIAAITHGHPTGYLAAGALARIIHLIVSGDDLTEAVEQTMALLKTRDRHEECLASLRAALDAWKNQTASPETVESLGGGWVAEEALAIGVYSALAAENDF
ncbi:MAG: ADP-ribosylglycohydrolase family protein, partial [Desulfobacterales bacterium]|nr:ADP-ribosylglycohydrolase family protein [Desulfobacterales bacterium]